MVQRYILVKSIRSKRYEAALPLRAGVTSSLALKVARRSVKKGFTVGPIATTAQVKKILLKQAPKKKSKTKRATVKRKRTIKRKR